MIPHSLHNKEYFWSYDENYDIFSLFFSSFNRKYLKLIKIDISVFEINSSYVGEVIHTLHVSSYDLSFSESSCKSLCILSVTWWTGAGRKWTNEEGGGQHRTSCRAWPLEEAHVSLQLPPAADQGARGQGCAGGPTGRQVTHTQGEVMTTRYGQDLSHL